MEVAMKLENFKGFKFECEKCGCVVTTGLDRKTILRACPNCDEGFSYNDQNDPIAHLRRALEAFESVKKVRISLICEEENVK